MVHTLVKLGKVASHPVVIFATLQVVWLAILGLWVVWFISQKELLAGLTGPAASTPNPGTNSNYGVVYLTLGCTLLGILLVGTIALFFFALKHSSLYRQQRGFVSSVTHELRSPLASIQLSFGNLQEKTLDDNTQKKFYRMIKMDLERLTGLINRILISSRLDKGIVDQNQIIEVFSLKDTLQQILHQLSHMDRDLTQRIRLVGDRELQIRCLRKEFTHIVSNLIENAIKYSPTNSPIEVAWEKQLTNIHLRVIDQGYGIDRKDLKKIFKMFHRTRIATRKAMPGTGLGLFIVKSSAKLIGATVWAESKGLGRGSTFVLRVGGQ